MIPVFLIVTRDNKYVYDGPFLRFYFNRSFADNAAREIGGWVNVVSYDEFHRWRIRWDEFQVNQPVMI